MMQYPQEIEKCLVVKFSPLLYHDDPSDVKNAIRE